jgi:hypothetical protein
MLPHIIPDITAKCPYETTPYVPISNERILIRTGNGTPMPQMP